MRLYEIYYIPLLLVLKTSIRPLELFRVNGFITLCEITKKKSFVLNPSITSGEPSHSMDGFYHYNCELQVSL